MRCKLHGIGFLPSRYLTCQPAGVYGSVGLQVKDNKQFRYTPANIPVKLGIAAKGMTSLIRPRVGSNQTYHTTSCRVAVPCPAPNSSFTLLFRRPTPPTQIDVEVPSRTLWFHAMSGISLATRGASSESHLVCYVAKSRLASGALKRGLLPTLHSFPWKGKEGHRTPDTPLSRLFQRLHWYW